MNPSSEREALLELLRLARPHVEHGAKRYYDGVGGYVRRDEAKALLDKIDRAALSTQPQQAGWMPIETAPKTGRTLLLGYFNSAGNWRTMPGQWMSQYYIDEYWEEPDDVEPGWFETVVESDDIPNCWPTDTTHWMPLPPVPGQEGVSL